MEDKYVRVKKSIIYNKDLTAFEKILLEIFIDRQEYHNHSPETDTGEWFYCYTDWIAENAGVNKRTVLRAIPKLQKLGYLLVKKESYQNGVRNMYSINSDLLVVGDKSALG